MSRWWCWGKKGGTQEFNFFTVCHERVNIFAIWLLNKHLIGIQTIWISQEWIRHIRQTHLDMFLIARLNILSIMPWTWLFRHKNYSRCVKGLGVITVTVRSRDLACVESHQEALRVVLQKKGVYLLATFSKRCEFLQNLWDCGVLHCEVFSFHWDLCTFPVILLLCFGEADKPNREGKIRSLWVPLLPRRFLWCRAMPFSTQAALIQSCASFARGKWWLEFI